MPRKRPNVSVAGPYPRERLGDFWAWCQPCKSRLRALTRDEFIGFFAGLLDQSVYSLGIYADGELSGALFLEPAGEDANIAMVLARRLWGFRVMDAIGEMVLRDLFTTHPHLQSITANVVGYNNPERRLLTSLGYIYETTSAGAVTLAGVAEDLHTFRLRREDFFDGMLQRTNDNHD